MHIPTLDLAPNYQISRVIKGGWQLAGGHGSITKEQAIADMFAFADAGISTFDCADIYTGVEELIGTFREAYRNSRSAEALSQIKVHTKFVPDLNALPTLNSSYVTAIIDRSLKRLCSERLDLVQFHWWDYDVPRYVEVAGYLADLQRQGKIAHLGVTNFDVPHLTELIKSGVPIISNQVQYSVMDRRPEGGMVAFTQAHGIKLLCYGTVAGGFLSEKYLGAPEPQGTLTNRSLTKYKLIIDEFGSWALFQELLRALARVATRHHSTIGNVATRYVLEQPGVASAIVGATNTRHLTDTTRLFAFTLDQADQNEIRAVTDRATGPHGDTYAIERVKGGVHGSIMKYNLNTHTYEKE